MTDEKPYNPMQEEDYLVSLDGAAPYVNRFFITMQEGILRLTFAEQDQKGKSLRHRASVTMSPSVSHELSVILTAFLNEAAKKPGA